MSENNSNKNGINRRDWIKAMATVPVLGTLGVSAYYKWLSGGSKKEKVLSALNLEDIKSASLKNGSKSKGDLVRIGIIGFGVRGEQDARALGYALPGWLKRQSKENVTAWSEQENLNVAITGICDVFDEHAEAGLVASECDFQPQRIKAKRYKNYKEMLDSKEIDAVIVTTPDFHHAQMAADAVKAGKHVYVEKCMSRTEEEVYMLEDVVKNRSDIVFQVGHQYCQNTAFQQAKEVLKRNVAGKISLIETTTNRNSPHGAWIRHTNSDGSLKPGNPQTIDWQQWLGDSPKVPFSVDRFYNWTKWWDYATGLSGQLMSHEVDLANQLLGVGIPHSCSASGGIYFYKDNREIPDVFHAVFEYPQKDLTLVYSASLASEFDRGRTLMGHDATIKLGNSMELTIDPKSTKYKDKLDANLFTTDQPTVVFDPSSDKVDAVTSATEKYYASRGLLYTYQDGKKVDTTYLHLREWLNGIRFNTPVSVPIDKGVEVTIACHMATKSYKEKRTVFWDPVKRRIV